MTISRRVVVTGVGLVTPIGCGCQRVWSRLLAGEIAIETLKSEDYESVPSKIAGKIPENELNLDQHYSTSEQRSMSRGIMCGVIAAKEALTDAKWKPEDTESSFRTGVAVGMGMGDIETVEETTLKFKKKGYSGISPYFIPRILPNMTAGHISIKFGLKGPNHSVATACATGAHAIGDGATFIRRGIADVMVCGGAEAAVTPLSLAGFCRARALTTKFNSKPQLASRPFDKDRSGFVMGEGAGILVLEELEHAKSRGAKIYAELLGYGLSGDASHITAPSEDGSSVMRCMQLALDDANVSLTDVGYVNAHATSTPLGDLAESTAIQKLFGDHSDKLQVSSIKGSVGHLLGAAGSVEAAATVKACHTGLIPPTVNLDEPGEGLNLNYVPKVSQTWTHPSDGHRRIALSNSFGFGGTNTSLCFGSFIK